MYETWSWHSYSYAFGFLLRTGCDKIQVQPISLCTTDKVQQCFSAFARDTFFFMVQNAARYRFCNSIDVQIRLWLWYCDNTRGFQTFRINRQGLECQMSMNRIQHSYNPNFSELELSKVRLTYTHQGKQLIMRITILQSLKLTHPNSWLCEMRLKSMHRNTKS